MLPENDLTDIREVFEGRGDVDLAYLYGSVATGTEREGSDVDVGVLFDEVPGAMELASLARELEAVVGREVDLRTLNGRGPIFLNQVVKHGEPIYRRSEGERIRFETKVLDEYLDYLPFFEHYNEVRRRAMT